MAYALIANAAEMDEGLRLCVEVDLSYSATTAGDDSADATESKETSWMPMSMPPAYEEKSLREFLESVGDAKKTYRGMLGGDIVPQVGIKLPPYLYREQFEMVGRCLRDVRGEGGDGHGANGAVERNVVDFVVCTHALPGCLGLMREDMRGMGTELKTKIQSFSGPAVHPLALANVLSLRQVLDCYPETRDILIIGCGGVVDRDGYDRMRRVGAGAVGVGNSLRREGVGVFGKMLGNK